MEEDPEIFSASTLPPIIRTSMSGVVFWYLGHISMAIDLKARWVIVQREKHCASGLGLGTRPFRALPRDLISVLAVSVIVSCFLHL